MTSTHRRYIVGVVLLLAGLYWLAGAHLQTAGHVALFIFVFAAPIFLFQSYIGAARQHHRNTRYVEGSLLHRLFGGWILRFLAALILATLTGISLTMKSTQADSADLVLAGGAVILLPLTFRLMWRGPAKQFRYRMAHALQCSAIIVAVALAIVDSALATLNILPPQATHPFAAPAPETGSALYLRLSEIATIADEAEGALAGMAYQGSRNLWVVLATLLALNLFSFLGIAWILCALFLRPRHRLQALIPISNKNEGSTEPLFLQTAFLTLFVLLFFLPITAWLESVAKSPSVTGTIETVKREVERLGDTYVAPGTLEALQALEEEWAAENAAVAATLSDQITVAFDQARSQVDPFLDWYYTLTAEIARTLELLTGQGEDVIQRNLEKILTDGPGGQALPEQIRQARAALAHNRATLELERDKILNANRVTLSENEHPVIVAEQVSLIALLPGSLETQLFKRLGVSGTGGAVTTAATLTTKKLVAKGVFKPAVNALVKFAAAKGIGGAAAGAGLGTLFGPIGTIVGGIFGGIVGALVVDKVLIELEELYGRDQFKSDILASIDEAETALRAELGLTATP